MYWHYGTKVKGFYSNVSWFFCNKGEKTQKICSVVQYAALDAAGLSEVFIALICSLQCLLPRQACPLMCQCNRPPV